MLSDDERLAQIRERQDYRAEWAYGDDIEFLLNQNTALREQLAQSQAEVERFSTLADEERDAQIGTWDEFVAKFNKKYPRLPLYDTENCRRYVQRAVKFITQGHVD